jgi:hypothetical protein
MNKTPPIAFFKHLLGLRRGVADVLADEVVARDRDEMSPSHVAELVQDLSHARGDCGLARSGIAGEAHVQGWRLRGEAELRPDPLDEQERCDFPDALLDRLKPDQLVIELLEDGAYARLGELVGKPDGRRRLSRNLGLGAHG